MAWPPRIPWVAVWLGTTGVAVAALVTGLTLIGSAIDLADPGRPDRLPPPLRQPLVDGCASGACAVDDVGDSTIWLAMGLVAAVVSVLALLWPLSPWVLAPEPRPARTGRRGRLRKAALAAVVSVSLLVLAVLSLNAVFALAAPEFATFRD